MTKKQTSKVLIFPAIFVKVRQAERKQKFLRLLVRDLKLLGLKSSLRRKGTYLQLKITSATLPIIALIRLLKIEQSRRNQAVGFAKSKLTPERSASLPNAESIQPMVEFCRTSSQWRLFRECCSLQSVPAPKLLFRQIGGIVRDAGDPKQPLIGVFGLSSSVFSLRSRDEHLNWVTSPDRKKAGLNNCMQLAVCVAMAPYNQIRGAKLIAALAATHEVALEFESKYHHHKRARLETIVTTSATGIHSPIFNRIMLCPGGLYRRIGLTSGYSTAVFGRDTVRSAHALVRQYDGKRCIGTERSIQLLKRALNICGIPREPFVTLGVRKGVYLAERKKLQNDRWPTIKEVVAYWKTREASKAMNKARTAKASGE